MQVNPKGKRGNKCINFRKKKRLFVSYFLVGGKLNKEKS